MKQINLRLSEDTIERIEKAKGGIAREVWLRQVIEQALSGTAVSARTASLQPAKPAAPAQSPPYRQRVPGPNVLNVRSSEQARRDVKPIPKGKSK